MTGDPISLTRRAQDPEEVTGALRAAGVSWLFWQTWEDDVVRTWDAFAPGFFEHYYGTDADRDCVVATAVRRGWPAFTFRDAYTRIGASPESRAAEQVWRAFGVTDLFVVGGGWAEQRSILVGGFRRPAGDWLRRNRELAAMSVARMDAFLLESRATRAVPRTPFRLSAKQRAVLEMQIAHPELTGAEQAVRLGISRRMLEKRHAQIAERFGVSSFAGAVAIAARGAPLL